MKKKISLILGLALLLVVSLAMEQQSAPTGKEISIDLGKGVKMQMVLIHPGEFLMGSPLMGKGRGGDETQHRVRITKPFYIGKYEVTQEQWQAVMRNNPSKFKGAKNPVERVSWNDCQRFIKRLNSIVPGGGFRLPTEAEWEYAARAGTTTRFYWGDDPNEREIDNYAWYGWDKGNTRKKTHPVGTKKPNPWGLYDISGNVWEWCSDWYSEKYYNNSPVNNPQGPASGKYKVTRGGGWHVIGIYCRSANRLKFPPVPKGSGGIRCARTP